MTISLDWQNGLLASVRGALLTSDPQSVVLHGPARAQRDAIVMGSIVVTGAPAAARLTRTTRTAAPTSTARSDEASLSPARKASIASAMRHTSVTSEGGRCALHDQLVAAHLESQRAEAPRRPVPGARADAAAALASVEAAVRSSSTHDRDGLRVALHRAHGLPPPSSPTPQGFSRSVAEITGELVAAQASEWGAR
jgi:hypothetical protein